MGAHYVASHHNPISYPISFFKLISKFVETIHLLSLFATISSSSNLQYFIQTPENSAILSTIWREKIQD